MPYFVCGDRMFRRHSRWKSKIKECVFLEIFMFSQEMWDYYINGVNMVVNTYLASKFLLYWFIFINKILFSLPIKKEVDAIFVIHLIIGKNKLGHQLNNLVRDYRFLMRQLQVEKIRHIYREDKRCAHLLANTRSYIVEETFKFIVDLYIYFFANNLKITVAGMGFISPDGAYFHLVSIFLFPKKKR